MACQYCSKPDVASGLCEDHYRIALYRKWSPDRGWQGLYDFGFDCFPQALMRERGHPDGLPFILENITSRILSRNGVLFNMMTAGCFRGYSKSTWLGNIVPLWCIGYGLKKFIVLMNDSMQKALSVSMHRLKLNMMSEYYTFVFGNMNPKAYRGADMPITKWNDSLILCNNRDLEGRLYGTMVMGVGLNQSIRSMVGGNYRPDLLIMDDVESEKNTKSELVRDGNYDIFWNQDIPAMDSENGAICGMATPVHIDGMYFKIRKSSTFFFIEKPVYKKDEDGYFLRDENGDYVPEWPAFWPLSKCLATEQFYRDSPRGVRGFNQEYLLTLESDETRHVASSLIQYAKLDIKFHQGQNWCKIVEINGSPNTSDDSLYYQPMHVVCAVDPAAVIKGKGCYSAILYLGTISDGRMFVLGYEFGKFNDVDILYDNKASEAYYIEQNVSNIKTPGTLGVMFRGFNTYHPDVVAVETVNAYVFLYRRMVETMNHWYYPRHREHHCQIISYLPPQVDKDDRIISIMKSVYGSGKIFHSGRIEYTYTASGQSRTVIPMDELYHQVVNYGSWPSKDLADALSIAITHSKRPNQRIFLRDIDPKHDDPWESFLQKRENSQVPLSEAVCGSFLSPLPERRERISGPILEY